MTGSWTIRIGTDALFQIVEALPDGGEFAEIDFAFTLRQMFQAIYLPAASCDECQALREGHRIEVFTEADHSRCCHIELLSDELLSASIWSADHSGNRDRSQAQLTGSETRRGGFWMGLRPNVGHSSVTFMPADCCLRITHRSSRQTRKHLLQVETLFCSFVLLGCAKGICLYGLILLFLGIQKRCTPLDLVGNRRAGA